MFQVKNAFRVCCLRIYSTCLLGFSCFKDFHYRDSETISREVQSQVKGNNIMDWTLSSLSLYQGIFTTSLFRFFHLCFCNAILNANSVWSHFLSLYSWLHKFTMNIICGYFKNNWEWKTLSYIYSSRG